MLHRRIVSTCILMAACAIAVDASAAQDKTNQKKTVAKKTQPTAQSRPTGSVAHIKELLDANKGAEAFAYAKTIEPTNIGDPEFDFQFAMAAMADNHPEKAVFALKRVILAQPTNYNARLFLGRCYFLLADYESARFEFDSVTAAHPPADVQAKINQFTVVIDRQRQAQYLDYGAFASFYVGHDTNVNSATDQDIIGIPHLGMVTLNNSSVKLVDDFAEYTAGMWGNKPITQHFGIFGFGQLVNHTNFDTPEFNQKTGTLVFGPTYTYEEDIFRMPIMWQQLFLDDYEFRRIGSVSLEWLRRHGNNTSTMYAQLGYYKYPEDLQQNVNFVLAGANWQHNSEACPISTTWGIYGSHENPETFAGDYNGRNLGGANLSVIYQWRPEHQFFGNAGGYYADYEATHPIFLVKRKDWYANAGAGYVWQTTPKLAFTTDVNYQYNHSNIDIFQFTRWVSRVGFKFVV